MWCVCREQDEEWKNVLTDCSASSFFRSDVGGLSAGTEKSGWTRLHRFNFFKFKTSAVTSVKNNSGFLSFKLGSFIFEFQLFPIPLIDFGISAIEYF